MFSRSNSFIKSQGYQRCPNLSRISSGQGTIEYLIIIAIIVVIGLVVVSMLSGMLSPASGVSASLNKVGVWSNSVALTESSVNPDGNYLVRLANMSGEEFTITNVAVGDVDANYSEDLFMGGAQNFVVGSGDVCSTGDNVSKDVIVTYVSKNGIRKVERYPAKVFFMCENYTVSLLADQCTTYTTRTLDGSTVSGLAGYYAAFNLSTIDVDLATANIKSGVSIFGVAGSSDVVNTSSGTAGAGQILDGYVAWVDGSEVTGSVVTQTLSADSVDVDAGYYAETDLNVIDSDLNSDSILDGVTIFGITGTASAGGGGVEADFHFSETKDYFVRTDPGGQGIVTDSKNGLIWQDGIKGGTDIHANAITYCTNLNWGGFSSGWRLPTVYELYTLVDITYSGSNYFPSAFQTVGSTYEYSMWSSTSVPNDTSFAYNLNSNYGNIYYTPKTVDFYNGVRCVRSE